MVLHRALVEIRMVASQGNCEQAYDLADAVHNIPMYLDSADFDWTMVVRSLRQYHAKYPRPEGDVYFDYVALLGEEGSPRS
ncbi:MAG TPA: hypothetical protein VFS60_14340 [Thermoanaerobaculia bacterium]|nr:hypothetical protein [Thermoanaerobaculia bacterium]